MRRGSLTFALLLALALPVRAAAQEIDFFFYSPQVGPDNLSLLKQTADAYFRESGMTVRFQSFVRFEDLETEASQRRPQFLLVPRWVFTTRCLDPLLTPLARPIRNGRMNDRRALMAGRSITRTEQLDGGAIAATVPATGDNAGEAGALARFRSDHPNVRVIPVPKDVDALLAVGFGQVDAAFVSLAQFDMLSRVNPAVTAGLHEIGYSDETPFPQVYATSAASPDVAKRMEAVLEGTVHSETGRRLSNLLGFDQWVGVEPTETPAARTPESCVAKREARR